MGSPWYSRIGLGKPPSINVFLCHIEAFTYCLWLTLQHVTREEVTSCNRDHLACKAWKMNYLNLYKNCAEAFFRISIQLGAKKGSGTHRCGGRRSRWWERDLWFWASGEVWHSSWDSVGMALLGRTLWQTPPHVLRTVWVWQKTDRPGMNSYSWFAGRMHKSWFLCSAKLQL